MTGGEGHLTAEQVHPGAVEFVERAGLRRREQVEGVAEAAGLQADLRRGQRAVGLPGRIGGQRDRTIEERRRRGESAAGLRPPGRALELERDLLVGGGGGLGPMPRPAIRIGAGSVTCARAACASRRSRREAEW